MLNIPLNAQVECSDGHGGVTTHAIVDPVRRVITHAVVKLSRQDKTERIVPVERVTSVTPRVITLDISRAQLDKLETFFEEGYVASPMPATDDSFFLYQPLARTTTQLVGVDHEHIPPGELAMRRGAHVQTVDGKDIGRLTEFLVDEQTGMITHLMVDHGRLFFHQELAIPVAAIDQAYEDRVYLRLTWDEIEALPDVPVERNYTWTRPTPQE